MEAILPVTRWNVETASFDIHKITNPEVSDIKSQEGPQKGFYNVKAFVLDRDGYTCQHGKPTFRINAQKGSKVPFL